MSKILNLIGLALLSAHGFGQWNLKDIYYPFQKHAAPKVPHPPEIELYDGQSKTLTCGHHEYVKWMSQLGLMTPGNGYGCEVSMLGVSGNPQWVSGTQTESPRYCIGETKLICTFSRTGSSRNIPYPSVLIFYQVKYDEVDFDRVLFSGDNPQVKKMFGLEVRQGLLPTPQGD